MNIKLFGFALALLELAAGDAIAKEGSDQYPNGAENWLAGAAPPPGNYFLNYFGHYGGSLHNGNGDKRRMHQSVPGSTHFALSTSMKCASWEVITVCTSLCR